MMLRHISVRWLAVMVSLLFVGTQVVADERPGKHKHDEKAPQGKPAQGHGHTTGRRTERINTPGGNHPRRNMPTPAAPAGAMRQRSPAANSSTRPTA